MTLNFGCLHVLKITYWSIVSIKFGKVFLTKIVPFNHLMTIFNIDLCKYDVIVWHWCRQIYYKTCQTDKQTNRYKKDIKENMKPIFPIMYNQSTNKMCTGKYYKRLMFFAQNPSWLLKSNSKFEKKKTNLLKFLSLRG